MKNTLSDLNDYLFEQLERINDDDLDDDDLEKQMKKADAACKIADRIIQNGELAFKTMKHMDDTTVRNLRHLRCWSLKDEPQISA